MADNSRLYHIFIASSMLISGSINTLVKKAQNDCKSVGLPNVDGEEYHKFEHPWFQSLLMFIGEFMCLFGLLYHRYKERKKFQEDKDEGIASDEVESLPYHPRICQVIMALPAICDVFGTTLSGIGLLYVDASVFQMLRGSVIVFTGIFSRVFLKRQLKITHWLGILITVVGLSLVGLSSILSSSHNKSQWHTILGVILIVSSQIVSATQMVVEETFLKKRKFHPLHVVGMEGVFGILFMAIVALPVVYFIPGSQHNHSYDNSLDALLMIKNNSSLLVFSLLYLTSIAFYNFFGLAVTRSLTAVHRTLLDACRTMIVWAVSLFIYYTINKDFGEQWKSTYGVFEVDGFLLLIIGTAMYNQLFDFSWICPSKKEVPEEEDTIQRPDYRFVNAASPDPRSSERDRLLSSTDEDKQYNSFEEKNARQFDQLA